MNKFKKSLFVAFRTSLVISVSILFFFLFSDDFQINRLIDEFCYFFSRFFLPLFFSNYFIEDSIYYNRKSLLQYFFKVVFYSLFILLSFYILTSYNQRFGNFNFYLYDYIHQILFCIVWAISTSLYVYVSKRKKRKKKQLKYTIKILSFSWFFVTFFGILFIVLEVGFEFYHVILLFMGGIFIWLMYFLKGKRSKERSKLRAIFIIVFFSILCSFGYGVSFVLTMEKEVIEGKIIFAFLGALIVTNSYFLLIAIVNHFITVYIDINKEKDILKEESIELELNYEELKSQLSPGFLFSNIQFLTNLIEVNSTKAIHFSEKLSHVYRFFLEQEKEDIVKIKDEISFIKAYLDLLTNKSREELLLNINVDEKHLEKYIVTGVFYQILKKTESLRRKKQGLVIRLGSTEESLTIEFNLKIKLKKEVGAIQKRYSYFTETKIELVYEKQYTLIKFPLLTE